MFCPHCGRANPAEASQCTHCHQETGYIRDRLFLGNQFIFVTADEQHPVTLEVDKQQQTYRAPAILSRHQHSIAFGDLPPLKNQPERRWRPGRSEPTDNVWPIPDQTRLSPPRLRLITVVTDRKIYKPDNEAVIFIVVPDAANDKVRLEVKRSGQKVYETDVTLNRDGLALHHYTDLKEGEYTAEVTWSRGEEAVRADCTFSVAEFTLSPLIATLEKHRFDGKTLIFTLKLLLLSVPYNGPAELGLQCRVCGERVVATQQVEAKNGMAEGQFNISGHGGPFHVQVTTPDGNTAGVAFPGSGAEERRHVVINHLGQTMEMGLLPWETAQPEPVRGFYLGPGEFNLTPLTLESVHADRGQLKAVSDFAQVQVIAFNPRNGESRVIECAHCSRGEAIAFETDAPYTLFVVGALPTQANAKPFEGWGIVIRPVAFAATLTAPQTARPGDEIAIQVALSDQADAFCWLLVYDARLEHESPLPRLARRIYDGASEAARGLACDSVASVRERPPYGPPEVVPAFGGNMVLRVAMPRMVATAAAMDTGVLMKTAASPMARGQVSVAEKVELMPPLALSPARMEFPELVYQELFALDGRAERKVKLGGQIGTWRVRAYVCRGADLRELTADVQAEKPLYAELDLPAIASDGDQIVAAVNYFAPSPSDLIVTSRFGQTRKRVVGSGVERFVIEGPGRVEARIEHGDDFDWSVRDVAPPGIQKVTASQLLILEQGQTVRGEKVVVYPSLGHILADTIAALIRYPFG